MKVLGKIFLFIILFFSVALVSGWFVLQMLSGSETRVPSVVGKELLDGIKILQDNALYAIVEKEEHDPEAPRGTIIQQRPASGTLKKKYAPVKLVISKGPDRILMPDFRNTGIRQARSEIETICSGTIDEHYVHHKFVRQGDIIGHSPGPGEIILPNTIVRVLVSLGPAAQFFKMPDLIGVSIDLAQQLLSPLFTIVKKGINSEIADPGTIIDQDPSAGQKIAENKTITITFAKSDQVEENSMGIFIYHVPSGLLSKNMEIKLKKQDGTEEIVYSRFVSPGEEVKMMIPKTGKAVLSVILNNEEIHTELW